MLIFVLVCDLYSEFYTNN